MVEIQLGQKVEIKDGFVGIVRHHGPTSFADGIWVGLELSEPGGKNDGSVKGHRYFTCKPAHGSFIREAAIVRALDTATSEPLASSRRSTLVSQRTSLAPTRPTGHIGSRTGSQASSRHGSPTKRPSLASHVPSKAASAAVPPATHLRSSSAVSNTQLGSGAAIADPLQASVASVRPRPSLAAASREPRDTIAVPATTLAAEPRQPTIKPQQSVTETISPRRSIDSGARAADHTGHGVPVEDDVTGTLGARGLEARADVPPETAALAPSSAASKQIDNSKLQEQAIEIKSLKDQNMNLKAKLRDITKGRTEDHKKLNENAHAARDRDRLNDMLIKQKQRYKPLEQELADLRKSAAGAESQKVNVEDMQTAHDTAMEEAALDREIAEEQAEVLKAELESLRETNEELKLELDILKSENNDLGRELGPDERASQSFLQLERSNERLREALIRLRDISQDNEADLKAQLEELQKEADATATLRENLASSQTATKDKDALIQDLQVQLEAAQGSEDLVEDMSDQIHQMQEQAARFKEDIENLESLNVLNDELITNHIESEKQFQQEIDFRDTVIAELDRRSKEQEASIEQHDTAVVKFRQAVQLMQTELAELRASRQVSEVEADDLAKRSKQLMDRNLQLSSSAVKVRVKEIDLELERMHAEESARHLAIVQHFLPEAYKVDKGSTMAVLRIIRIRFKAALVKSQIRERLADTNLGSTEQNMTAYSAMDQLSSMVAICERFDRHISACSIEQFRAYQAALYDLEPVEKILQGQLENLKQDSTQMLDVDQEMRRAMAIMTHLASVHIEGQSVADGVLAQAEALHSRLECMVLALIKVKQLTDDTSVSTEEQMAEEDGLELSKCLTESVARAKQNTLQAGRLHQDLLTLYDQSLGLQESDVPDLFSASLDLTHILKFVCTAGENIFHLLSTRETSNEVVITAQDILSCFKSASQDHLTTEPSSQPLDGLNAVTERMSLRITESLTTCADQNIATKLETPPPPWIELSHQIVNAQSSNTQANTELARLKSLLSERSLQIRQQEQATAEQKLKIEVLEARTADAGDKQIKLQAYEEKASTLQEACDKAKIDAERTSQLTRRLRDERDDLRKKLDEVVATGSTVVSANVNPTNRLELDVEKSRVKSLQATVRQLSDRIVEARSLKPGFGSTTDADLSWLKGAALQRPRRPAPKESLLKEERAMLRELLAMSTDLKPVDLSSLRGQDKLKWRPASQTAVWGAQKRREEWETWLEWQQDLASRATKSHRGVKKPVTARPERLPLIANEKPKDGMNNVVMIANEA